MNRLIRLTTTTSTLVAHNSTTTVCKGTYIQRFLCNGLVRNKSSSSSSSTPIYSNNNYNQSNSNSLFGQYKYGHLYQREQQHQQQCKYYSKSNNDIKFSNSTSGVVNNLGEILKETTNKVENESSTIPVIEIIPPIPEEVEYMIDQASMNPTVVESEPLLDPIVKVFSVLSSPNHFTPWQMKPQREITGSGFVIKGRRILTNAHVIADQTSVMLTKFGNPNKYHAKLIAVAHEYDIAMLTVEEDDFWEGIEPLELGDIPELQDTITVIGFPTGGNNICVTQGVVSRIDLQQYAHSESRLLSIQIDAAINPGNSGGPALMEGKVVGIAFQNLAGASSVGFIIPTPVINRFLEDIERNQKFTGEPMMGIITQSLDSIPKKYYKIPTATTTTTQDNQNITGILVNEIHPLSAGKEILKVQDIITHIDGVEIANDGSIAFRRRERISYEYLLSRRFIGDLLDIRVFRDGQSLDIKIPLVPQFKLVPFQLYDKRPSYFVFGGFVFVPLTYPLLVEISDEFASTFRRVYEKVEKVVKSPTSQVVVISQVLIDKINHGYSSFGLSEVKKVNGVPIKNLAHLVELIESNTNQHIVITLDHDYLIILDKDEVKEANIRILKQHAIPSPKSNDLLLI